jgi:predicted transcriptional regulator
MSKRITEEQKKEIRKHVAEGELTQKEIADKVGCSVPAIAKYGKEEVEEEAEEVEEEEELEVNDEEISGTPVEDFYEKIMDAKDDHIRDLRELNKLLIGVLSGKPISTIDGIVG